MISAATGADGRVGKGARSAISVGGDTALHRPAGGPGTETTAQSHSVPSDLFVPNRRYRARVSANVLQYKRSIALSPQMLVNFPHQKRIAADIFCKIPCFLCIITIESKA